MSTQRRPRDPERTKAEMVDAALETLRGEGFTGTTARAIAERGGFNQALIFYHFGGVNQLLLAALDASSAERMERYRAALAKATTLDALIRAAARLYREDVEGGHVTIVSELTGASLAHPELAPAVTARMQPWLELTRETFEQALQGSPLAALVPLREVAYAFVALYLGLNLLSHLDPKGAPVDELFALLRRVAPLLEGHPNE